MVDDVIVSIMLVVVVTDVPVPLNMVVENDTIIVGDVGSSVVEFNM